MSWLNCLLPSGYTLPSAQAAGRRPLAELSRLEDAGTRRTSLLPASARACHRRSSQSQVAGRRLS